MGRSSSSSRKKKRSKNSSQVRSKKKSEIRSRKSKSKKLRRHYSSDEDDDSRSSMSGSDYSSSSSEDTKHRSRRYRVHSRKRVVKKKKARHSYSSESSEDSPRDRKRSGSKRKRDYASKSKSSKKKRKRDDCVSHTSSGSLSCSTCEDDSISSREVGFDRHRRKLGKKERDERSPKKVESESEKSRDRSLSPFCSENSGNSEYRIEQRVSVDNHSRRLRSIIVTLTHSEKAERESSQNEDKEVMYVHDDHEYPYSRSNNSIDSESKREEQEKITRSENEEKGDAIVISALRSPKNINVDNVSEGNVRDRFDEFEKIDEKASKVSDDLEAVLRLKALENLKKFRGAVAIKKAKNDSEVSDVVSTGTDLDKDTTLYSQIGEKRKNLNTDCKNIDYPINRTTKDGGSVGKVKLGVSAAKPKLVRPVFARQYSETNSTPKEASKEPNKPQSELSDTKSSLVETDSRITSTLILNSDNGSVDANDTNTSVAYEPSSNKSALEETSSDKPQDDGSDGSQFEKKTMSVMHGGEMVQVKYQVYIPKSAPALVRRKLKR